MEKEEFLQALEVFIIGGKKNGYVADIEPATVPEFPNSKLIVYARGDWTYKDLWCGFDPFGGQELVFWKNEPVWRMGYYGLIVRENAAPYCRPDDPKTNLRAFSKEIYDFLKRARLNTYKEGCFLGTSYYREEPKDQLVYDYWNRSVGNVTKFGGKETILFRLGEVYQLTYQGGLIQD